MTDYAALPPAARAEVDAIIDADRRAVPWRPLVDEVHPATPTPQRIAYDTPADFLLYGGAAGGGKTDLLIGLALTQHRRSIIWRREYRQLAAVVDRAKEIVGTAHFREHPESRFLFPDGRLIRFGGMAVAGDERGYQGQPYDLMAFDELTEFLESQFRFVTAWNRTTVPGQRTRVVGATNPPKSADGEWVVRFWAPWIDPGHRRPAAPGELRWFISTGSGDEEVEGPSPITVAGEAVVPRSRTYIPSRVEQNPYLAATGYKAVLQGLPEPLRSQMLRGDWGAGRTDDPWQVCPTAWVEAAQARWANVRKPDLPMSALGFDPAVGGDCETVLSPRYGWYFAEQIVVPGKDTPDGPANTALVVQHLRDRAQVNVDIVGPAGGPVFGHLNQLGLRAVAMNGADPTELLDRTRRLGFFNKRAEWHWRMREALDPDYGEKIALPPDRRLLADLCAPRWTLTPRGIKVELKAEIKKRLGRSPDRGDAAVLALNEARMFYATGQAGKPLRIGAGVV